MLQNGGFENGWQDLPPTASGVTNQQPDGWRLAWVARGGVLYDDAGATAGDAPVCVHMLSRQLPPHEHRGAADALILDGDTTYKIFHSVHPFGATLAQMSLAWCLKNPHVTSVITGASRAEQVRENMKALDVVPKLTPDVMTAIEAAVA